MALKKVVAKNTKASASSYVGKEGELFFDPENPVLRFSNGSTPGGVQFSGGSGDTGDITFDAVKIIGAGTASGDGNGYSTIELVPDTTLYGNDQYLVIDPTQPNHIHIRAGGTQDSSNAEFYLGGEEHYVRIVDGQGIRLQNQNVSTPSYFYSDTTDFTNGTWYESGGAYYIQYTSINAELDGKAFDNIESITVNYTGGFTNLTYAGSASNLGGGVYRVQVNEVPPASPTALTSIEYYIFLTRTNSIVLENNDFTVSVTDDIRITANDVFSLRNNSVDEAIEIHTDYDGNDHIWRFNPDGSTELPNEKDLVFLNNGEVGRIIPSVSDGSGLQVYTPNDLEIKVSASIWSFEPSGNLVFPDSTIQNTAWTGSSPGFTYTEVPEVSTEISVIADIFDFGDGTTVDMQNASINFTGATITGFSGTATPNNLINTHTGSSVIVVGQQNAVVDNLTIRIVEDPGLPDVLGVEFNYNPSTNSAVSCYRVSPSPTNVLSNSVMSPDNTNYTTVISNLSTIGDAVVFLITDSSFNKVYRVTVIADAMPIAPVAGQAFCIIEILR